MAGVGELCSGSDARQKSSGNRQRIHDFPFLQHSDMHASVRQVEQSFTGIGYHAVTQRSDQHGAEVPDQDRPDKAPSRMRAVHPRSRQGAQEYVGGMKGPEDV